MELCTFCQETKHEKLCQICTSALNWSTLNVEPIRCKFSLRDAIATFDLAYNLAKNPENATFVLKTLKSLVKSKTSTYIQSAVTKACNMNYKAVCGFLVANVDLVSLLEWRDDDNNTFLHLMSSLHDNNKDDQAFLSHFRAAQHQESFEEDVLKLVNG